MQRLCVISSLYTRKLFRYIMQVFPDLDENLLLQTYDCDNEIFMPLTDAVRLFNYLMKKYFVQAEVHFSGTHADLLLRLYDQTNKIQHLCLKYESNYPSSFQMKIEHLTAVKLSIELCYLQDIPVTLPRTSLIQKSGFNLLYLDIVMYELEEDEIDQVRNIQNEIHGNNSSSLSEILHYCPNLRDFSIALACLFDFGDGLQLEQKKRVYGKVTFNDNMFGPLFLSSLSRYASYISDLHMKTVTSLI
ncbi:hypothetical protein MFLAVUS_010527 [Mucor flavus]|uniref:Uncharacterized protein n=1 Tax=Mucor flavus TaxID=439312 RepID=A0ABP9ZD05_9FUNG